MHTDGIWCPTTTFKAEKCHNFLLYYGVGMHCLLQQHRNELKKQQWKLQSPPAPLLWGLPTSNTSISKTHNVPCPFTTTTTHIPKSRFVMSLSLSSLLFSSLKQSSWRDSRAGAIAHPWEAEEHKRLGSWRSPTSLRMKTNPVCKAEMQQY